MMTFSVGKRKGKAMEIHPCRNGCGVEVNDDDGTVLCVFFNVFILYYYFFFFLSVGRVYCYNR